MGKNKDEPIDIFKEGKMKSIISKSLDTKPKQANIDVKLSDEDKDKIKDMVVKGTTQWDILKNMIDGDLTERFVKELKAMPGKDFVRNYLKLIEHFKPKLTRADEGDIEKPDLNITIETMIINSAGEPEVIDITELQGDETIAGENKEENGKDI